MLAVLASTPRDLTLDRMLYGNTSPLGKPSAAPWLFEVVFDNSVHGPMSPQPSSSVSWPARSDVGFASRASAGVHRHLCRRVLVFHHFEGRLLSLARSLADVTGFDGWVTNASAWSRNSRTFAGRCRVPG